LIGAEPLGVFAMSDLWVVVPAAGESRRFKDAGYSIPKPFLCIRDKYGIEHYMLEHILMPVLTSYDLHNTDPIVGIPAGSHPPCTGVQYIPIEKTLGQADSTFQMIQNLPENDSVLVLDCDMILDTADIQKIAELIKIYDVVIAVAESFDPNASRVDTIPFPTRFVEKEPISQYAIVGARAFHNIGFLSKALERTIERYRSIGQEPYLSVAINHYPGAKYAHLITKYTDWGTPQSVKESGAEIVP
jgi:hypothetical protein